MWREHRKDNLNEIKNCEKNTWLAGNGQFDSPVQKGMGSGDLERKACESLINELIGEENCNIELFLTDRHRGIRYFLRTKYPQIEHEFDVWHLSKSLLKRLKGLDKKYPDAYLWKTSINNHLW
ncbi:hypothetical protein QTP88_021118 [Uroleucon formosanum]